MTDSHSDQNQALAGEQALPGGQASAGGQGSAKPMSPAALEHALYGAHRARARRVFHPKDLNVETRASPPVTWALFVFYWALFNVMAFLLIALWVISTAAPYSSLFESDFAVWFGINLVAIPFAALAALGLQRPDY